MFDDPPTIDESCDTQARNAAIGYTNVFESLAFQSGRE